MPWPMSQDYNEAIQSPITNFADEDLKRGEATTNAIGIPMPRSGNFADVYEVRCSDGSRWAVKCFTREVPGLRDRYQEIGAHLRRSKLPFMVDFSYLEKGIRVAGRWYPVLKMQWVEGLTLNQFASKYADNPAMLDALYQIWEKMAKYLRTAEVGHCDLQHGNVLLVPGGSTNSLALKLIDYDGMWVPALAGKPSGEAGHSSYQHPQRMNDGAYSIDVDRFPLLLIATALRSLKAGGRSLWEKYDNGDNMLFKVTDLQAPTKSPVFQELVRHNDAEVRKLAVTLATAAEKPLNQTPLLEQLSTKPISPQPQAAVGVAPVRTAESVFANVTSGPASARIPAKSRRPLIASLIGAGVLLMVCIIVMASSGPKSDPSKSIGKDKLNSEQARNDKPITKPGDDTRPVIKPNPPKIEPKVEPKIEPKVEPGQKVKFLSDMKEFDVKVAEGRFANKGFLGYSAAGSNRIKVSGKESPNGLSMCPNSNTYACAKFRIEKTAQTFLASVALNDTANPPPPTPLTFEVHGDGKVLWKSKPVTVTRSVQECKVDVTGVEVLELRVDCPGSYVNAQAVWLDPHVLLK